MRETETELSRQTYTCLHPRTPSSQYQTPPQLLLQVLRKLTSHRMEGGDSLNYTTLYTYGG